MLYFRLARQSGDCVRREIETQQGVDRPDRRDFERGAAGKPRPDRNVGGDPQLQRRYRCASAFEDAHTTADIAREIGQSAAVERHHAVERGAINLGQAATDR